MAQRNITGFPQFKRHLAAIHRMPPSHAPVRPFHVSDVIYSMLRSGVGKSLVRKGNSSPSSDSALFRSPRGMMKGPMSNTMWKSLAKKGY